MRLRIAVDSLLRGSLALALWLAFDAQPSAAQSADSLPILKTVRQARELPPEKANLRYPVELHAVVTFYYLGEYWAMFGQDETGGIFIKLSSTNFAKPGDHIIAQGTTDAGDYATMLVATNIIVESSGPLPPPHRASFEELASGTYDGAYVEVKGVVRLAQPGTLGRTYLEAIVDGQRLSALVSALSPQMASRLINATVRLRGACYSRPNSRRQMRAPWLAVTDESDIEILDPPRAQPLSMAITNLLRYNPSEKFGDRVKVRGVVALQQSKRAIYIVDGHQGLRIKTQQVDPLLVPGDVVEVVGFPTLSQYAPILEDATFTRVGHVAPPEPVDVQTDQLLSDGFDSALVRLRGKLLNKVHSARDLTLVADANNMILSAHLEHDDAGSDKLANLENGSEVELTGICALQPIENWNPSVNSRPQSFQLLLRSAVDVQLIAAPPWWTLSRLLWAVGIMSVTLLFGLMWLVALDRRVRRQTRIIQVKAQREAVLEERSRIAREFHDTLEQELAAISIQLDTVSAQFENSPAIARDLLELTRNMSRRSLAEARRSVWDLRSHLLENSNLVTALSEVAKGMGANSTCQIVVSTSGAPRKLSASFENNLLRLAQEALTNALKHARAKRISVDLAYLPGMVRLEVADDGVGFDPSECPSFEEGHFGLLDMRERVEKMGGTLTLDSKPGRGARIIAKVTLRSEIETTNGLKQDELSLEEAV